MLWTGAVVHRDRLRRSAPMLAPAPAGWRTTGGSSGRPRTRSGSLACAARVPRLSSAYGEHAAEARAAQVGQGQRRGLIPGHRPRTNDAVRETAYRDGAGTSRITGGCTDCLGARAAAKAGSPLLAG